MEDFLIALGKERLQDITETLNKGGKIANFILKLGDYIAKNPQTLKIIAIILIIAFAIFVLLFFIYSYLYNRT